MALTLVSIIVIIADLNISSAQKAIASLPGKSHLALQADVSSWPSQVSAFEEAISHTSSLAIRLGLVYAIAGIGEQVWIPPPSTATSKAFQEPNHKVLDVDLNGVLYTACLAIQYFRRLEKDPFGIRGRSMLACLPVCLLI